MPCVWYVEPLDEASNEKIGKALAECADANEQRGMPCSDSKKHNLWEIPFSFIERLVRSGELRVVHVWRSIDCAKPTRVTKVARQMYGPKKSHNIKRASELKVPKDRIPF